jgi:predicted dehydrogenase
MGRLDMREFLGFSQVQVTAVCDVDRNRLEDARQTVEQHYADQTASGTYRGCDAYTDFRELTARTDIDAVLIATPDHWHALPAIAAARSGKDIFLQKPLTYSIEEGKVLRDVVTRNGVVFQTGSQQRSEQRFRFACELVRNGRIGRLRSIEVGCGADPAGPVRAPMPVPDALDYDMWLGPAPSVPYIEDRVHPQQGFDRPGWLRTHDYCLGMVTGWGAHHMDIAQWGMGLDHSGPVEISARAQFHNHGVWDVHGTYRIEYVYANGVQVSFTDNAVNAQGIRFVGENGWVHVWRGGMRTEPESLQQERIGPDEVHLRAARSHKGNFLECVRDRSLTTAPVEVGHRACTACVLGDIAMQLQRPLRWDPDLEDFVGDPVAHAMLSRPMRAPWHL